MVTIMRRVKEIAKCIRKKINKYINGTQGVISLFMAIVMLPFSSTALLIVESARYQSAIEIVDEMLDCIGFSSIAEYDSYLEERFNVLAMSQELTPQQRYEGYLLANMPTISKSFTYTSVSATGRYSLANTDVLRTQILEYGEVTLAAEALYKGFDIDSLFKKLNKLLGIDELQKYSDATKDVADTVGSAADLITAVKETATQYTSYTAQIDEYKNAVNDFQAKTSTYISSLITAKSKLEEGDEPTDIYDDSAVKTALGNMESARNTLANEAGEMASSIDGMKTKIGGLFSAIEDITGKAYSAKNSYDDLSEESLADSCSTSTTDLVLQVAEELGDALKLSIDQTGYKEQMQQQATQLRAQKTKVSSVIGGENPGDITYKYYINEYTSTTQVSTDFPIISVNSIKGDLGSSLNNTVSKLDQQSAVGDTTGFTKLLDLAAELLNVTAFYNGDLDSNVSSTAFHSYNPGSMSIADTLIIDSINKVLTAGNTFIDSIKSINIFKALKAVATLLVGIVEFLAAIIAWAGKFLVNVVKLIASGSEIYDHFILAAYGAYNMSSRTNYKQSPYIDNFSRQGGISGNKISGSLDDLKTLMASPNGTGTDMGFKGAELEYLLIGGENELLNQSAAFFNLYLFRMLLNLPQIFTSKQVTTMVGAATVAGWVVYLALIIAEPMIDALLLVNGQSVYLIKDKERLFLTPAGSVVLLEMIPQMTGLPDSAKDAINDSLVASNGEAKPKGTFKMDYQEYMMLLLLLATDADAIVNRSKDIIQMEAAAYYKDEYAFDLDKSYTYIDATVDGHLNSMFDMDALTSGGPFTISRTGYVGY